MKSLLIATLLFGTMSAFADGEKCATTLRVINLSLGEASSKVIKDAMREELLEKGFVVKKFGAVDAKISVIVKNKGYLDMQISFPGQAQGKIANNYAKADKAWFEKQAREFVQSSVPDCN